MRRYTSILALVAAIALDLSGPAATAATIQLSPDIRQAESGTAFKAIVTLDAAARSDVRVLLRSSSVAVTVPREVTVPAGKTSAGVAINVGSVNADTKVTIAADLSAASAGTVQTSFTALAPATTKEIRLAPATVSGGQSSTATVSLSRAAGFGGVEVGLSSSNAGAASVPASLKFAQGVTSANFSVNAQIVSQTTNAVIAATSPSRSSPVSANLTVQAAPPPGIESVAPVTVRQITRPGGSRFLIIRNDPMRVDTQGSGITKAAFHIPGQTPFPAAVQLDGNGVFTKSLGLLASGSSILPPGDYTVAVSVANDANQVLATQTFQAYWFDGNALVTAAFTPDVTTMPGDGTVAFPGQRFVIQGSLLAPDGAITSGSLSPIVTFDGGPQAEILSATPNRLEVNFPPVPNCFGVKTLDVHVGAGLMSSQASNQNAIHVTVPCTNIELLTPTSLTLPAGAQNFVVRARGNYLGKVNPTITWNNVTGTVVPISQNEVEVTFTAPAAGASGPVQATTPWSNVGSGPQLSVSR